MFRGWFHLAGLLSLAIILVLSGRSEAEIGFRSAPAWEQFLDPIRFPSRYGLISTKWDSTSVDTALQLPAQLDTIPLQPADVDSILHKTAVDSLKKRELETGLQSSSTSGERTGTSSPLDSIRAVKLPPDELVTPADTTEPLPWYPTLVRRNDLIFESRVEFDTLTSFVLLSHRLDGVTLPYQGALTQEQYLSQSVARSDRETWRNTVNRKISEIEKAKGSGIKISIPVFKSKRAQRIFGGSNVGLQVTGDIQVNGNLRTVKRSEIVEVDNPNPTSYQFAVDQTQRFTIVGNVGEKVAVEIDQDSERLFEFENNLRVTYTGDPDEIIQSIQAGNVNLSLPGSRLVSASSRHEGLFGLKTESQIGALKLTTIASLDKGEKHTKSIKGGAETGRPISIHPRDFIKNKYFFLDYYYRDLYKHRTPNELRHYAAPEGRQIIDIEVYKSVTLGGDNLNAVRGWALFDPTEEVDSLTSPNDRDKEQGRFLRLEPGTEYEINREAGYIRLNQPMDRSVVLAVAYITQSDTIGDFIPPVDPESENFVLKLIKPKDPQPSDVTWDMMWRNVYDLRSTGIDREGFEGKITEATGDQSDTGYDTEGRSRSFIEIFGLDWFGPTGELTPDGQIDGIFIDFARGEIHFPDLKPFDPEGWFKGEGTADTIRALIDSTYILSSLYDQLESQLNQVSSDLVIKVQYQSVSATFDLGFNVLEGSEEVILNGQRLNRGSDYTVDYISGILTVLRRDALAAGADLEIKYETGQLFQLDTKTMLGLRAEYELWEDSHIGTTLLYYNEKTLDQRIRLGAEPTRNSIWDINAQLTFRPAFLTRAVDWLPLIETNAPSRLVIEGEAAQVYPNPNSMNSPSTGDNNGVAYLDDFESVKRTFSLGINRGQWSASGFPTYHTGAEGSWLKQRGRLIWYNPRDQVRITDIWPEREVEAQNSTTQVLKFEFQPWWTEWGATRPQNIDPEKSWGGVMRYIGAGISDLEQSKYIEIWLNRGSITTGEMYIDIGQISEDVIPNQTLDTEDIPIPGTEVGNGIIDGDEDVGLDGVAGGDPDDLVDINDDGILLPSYDDYHFDPDSDDYSHINGTENNLNEEGGRYPDTEDLDGDSFLDQVNAYYRYRIDLSELDNNRYIVGGLSNPKGWRLYRIPLSDTVTVGSPALTSVEYVRVWFTGIGHRGVMQIAQMEIVGNDWREAEVETPSGTITPLRISVLNTHDNPEPDYVPPPGVSGEVDPVSGLRAQEQSLVLKIKHLGTGAIGVAHKHLNQTAKMSEYRYLKMYVHGGGASGRLTDRFGRELDLEMFIRFGADTTRRFYEYSQRLHPGWDPENEIVIDLDRLTSLKFLREQDSTRNYDILPNGDVIRVIGEASIAEIRDIVIGIKNHGNEITEADEVEIWVDELRVSDINRDPGWAARGSIDLDISDLAGIRAEMTQTQADFHRFDRRTGSDEDELRGTAQFNIDIDKFFSPQWGLRLPLKATFSQEVSIPKYKPGSDVKLSALGGELTDVWTLFMDNLLDNDRVVDNPVYVNPTDSLISTSKSYTFSADISKSKPSENPILAYTVDRISIGGSHQETYSSDHSYQYRKNRVEEGEIDYNLSTDKSLELNWMSWAANIPILNRISESVLRPLPRSARLNLDGSENLANTKSRRGNPTERYRFEINRSYGLSWRPLEIINLDFSGEIQSDRIEKDSLRTLIASRMVEVDSTDYWVIDPDDDSQVFDDTTYLADYAEDLKRVKKGLFTKVFGNYFVDNTLTQNFTSNFTPRIVSWMTSDFSYNSRYRWDWSTTYGVGDRTVSVSSTFSTTLVLRLPQILGRDADQGGMAPQDRDKPGPAGAGEPGQYGRKPPGKDQDRDDPGIPRPGTRFSPPGTGAVKTGADGEPGTVLSPDDDPMAGNVVDSLSVPVDSIEVVEEPKPKVNPLKLLRTALSKLKDIRWEYSLSNDTRNNSVGPGQAKWSYRFGFTRDPGIPKVEGYNFQDTYGRRDEHRISTGIDLTRSLSISTLSYNFSQSKTGSAAQQESGSNSQTVFQYFDSDEITIRKFPVLNWNVRWTGLNDLEFVKKVASSVTVENSFQGRENESWRRSSPSSPKVPTRIEYEKSFSPVLGLSISWIGGISSNLRYNLTQRVTDERTGLITVSKSTTRTISASANYTARSGFKIPIPIWPFNNRRLQNSTSFSLTYNNNFELRETSVGGEKFTPTSETSSWTISPSIEYSFSTTVRGGFEYEYSVQKSDRTGTTKTQDFGFRVNISIRG